MDNNIRERRKAIKSEAKYLLALTFTNQNFPHEVHISNAGIKEWLNQPHKHYSSKNEALLLLPSLYSESDYIGAMPDSKGRQDVRCSHIFKVKIAEEDSWIVVHEMVWGTYLIHSISDNINLNVKQAT